VRAAVLAVAANIALSLALIGPLGPTGIALATSLAAWVNAAGLALALWRHAHLTLDADFRRRVPRIVLASAALAAGLLLAARALGPALAGGLALKIAGLAALVGGGALFYGALVLALAAVEPALVRRLAGRARKAGTPLDRP
jgi:putative peptidoglycan lipid II flippase